jgi:hypothetical protein
MGNVLMVPFMTARIGHDAPLTRPPHRVFRYGHATKGGNDIRIASGLPPVFKPNTVPRS